MKDFFTGKKIEKWYLTVGGNPTALGVFYSKEEFDAWVSKQPDELIFTIGDKVLKVAKKELVLMVEEEFETL